MSHFAKKWVHDKLGTLQAGHITVHENDQRYEFGTSDKLNATIQVMHPQFYSKLLSHGSLGAAQSYIDGDWQTDDLTTLLRIIIKNEMAMQKLDNYTKLQQWALNFIAKIKKNTITRSRENVHAHYDHGNSFFQTFLDESLIYSCALFEKPDDPLFDAQQRKMAKIAEKLAVKPKDHILEIGVGWGGLAIYLAQNYDCHVTATTISEQQFQYVQERISALNLQDKITLLNLDYRLLEGKYDKIVSIEVIEHMGHQFVDVFFAKCNALLKQDGLLMIQAITINEQTYDTHIAHIDFIKKYIFPGSCLLSIQSIGKSIAKHTDLQWLSLTDIGQHYTHTLRHWYLRFMNNINDVRKQGFSEEFIRIWQYYLCYCEAGFHEDYISDVQLVWRKRNA